MSAPRNEVVQVSVQNPHASMPLILPVLVVCNTSDEDLARNVRENSARDLPWIAATPAHARLAILVGGGASAADHLRDIRDCVVQGGTVFAMNGASRFLRGHGIAVDYQVIADAKQETSILVDTGARDHLFASQVHPETLGAVRSAKIWHLETGNIEASFPEARKKRGGYVLLGGGAAVGNSALCLAYAMGYRALHVFGFDSSHRERRSHAYDQPMNQFIPSVDVEWGGKTYHASVAMKAQAEKFQITAQALKQAGCTIELYGDGLLPAMYLTPPEHLSERDKYRLMWQFDGYRDVSPGEMIVDRFLSLAGPPAGELIVDFGCGTGRAAIALSKAGYPVMLVDFADNCRDDEALSLPFLEWDLTRPCPVQANWGLCTDVMEHIPTDDVAKVLANIMGSARAVFFQISTVADIFGEVVHQRLHNTVKPHSWWANLFASLGFELRWQEEGSISSSFYVSSQTGKH